MYAVLAFVSKRYSPLLGKFPRVTHPSATKVTGASSGPSFDLHVLGLPPAFVLSQDQTLKFDITTIHNHQSDRGSGNNEIHLKQITHDLIVSRMRTLRDGARYKPSAAACASLPLFTMSKSRSRERSRFRIAVSYTHLRAHETLRYLVCRLLLEKKMRFSKNLRFHRFYWGFFARRCQSAQNN